MSASGRRAGLRARLLQEDAWPDMPLPWGQPRRPLDTTARLLQMLYARATDRNPVPPPWRLRATTRWQTTITSPPCARVQPVEFVGVVAAWNEDDIIWSTVTNLYRQGCADVIVLDDGSDDGTAAEAVAAGATVRRLRNSGVWVEAERNQAIRKLVVEESRRRRGEIWWVVADADEFPATRTGEPIKDLLRRLPDTVDTLGSIVFEHLPGPGASRDPRADPLVEYPMARPYPSHYCPAGHWKHQVWRTRQPGDLLPMPGQHTLRPETRAPVREWHEDLIMHHVPFRDTRRLRDKLLQAGHVSGRYGGSPDTFTRWRMETRLRILDYLESGDLANMPNDFPGQPRRGVSVWHWRHLVGQ
jgi:glycosyl transferase family 2